MAYICGSLEMSLFYLLSGFGLALSYGRTVWDGWSFFWRENKRRRGQLRILQKPFGKVGHWTYSVGHKIVSSELGSYSTWPIYSAAGPSTRQEWTARGQFWQSRWPTGGSSTAEWAPSGARSLKSTHTAHMCGGPKKVGRTKKLVD